MANELLKSKKYGFHLLNVNKNKGLFGFEYLTSLLKISIIKQVLSRVLYKIQVLSKKWIYRKYQV